MVDIDFPHETTTTAPMRAQPPPPPFPTNLMQKHSHTLAVAVAIIGVLFMCTTGLVIASRHLKEKARQDNEKLSNLMIEMLELQTERQMENEAAYVKAKSLQNNPHISRDEPTGHKTYRFPNHEGTYAVISEIVSEESIAKAKLKSKTEPEPEPEYETVYALFPDTHEGPYYLCKKTAKPKNSESASYTPPTPPHDAELYRKWTDKAKARAGVAGTF